jgi:preprotein translocase subunit YajC
MFHPLLVLLAEGEATPARPPIPAEFIPLIALFILGYFFLIRPIRRQEKERQALLSSLKKGDKIITTSGIYGTVVAVSDKEDEMTVKVDDNVRLRMTKGVVQRNLTNEEAAREAKAKPAAPKSEAVTTRPEGGR